MATAYQVKRRALDQDILRLNSVGLSLSTIARALNSHPTTVSLRLKAMNVQPADTRRTFMEDVFLRLPDGQREWLADQLSAKTSIKDFIQHLIVQEFLKTNKPNSKETPNE